GIFYDSGGPNVIYGSNENYVLTICPESPGQFLELDFTDYGFSTQLQDVLTIYDGDSTSANSLGTFSGANNPEYVTATSSNTTGCLTLQFISNATGTTVGWGADISCRTPCQNITAQLDSTVPAINAEGNIEICQGDEVTFNGSGVFQFDGTGATYEWDFGNGEIVTGQTASTTYTDAGIYVVNLTVTDTNPLGCSSTNTIDQIVRVSSEVDFTGTQAADATLCFGESTTIVGVATPAVFEDCAPEIFDQTWLEDTPSTGQATSYSSTIPINCYGAGQVITDPSQITDLCIVIEHSFLGDLDMYLIAPNGAIVYFAEYGDGDDPGYNLGVAGPGDDGTPGTGWEYCFSPTATVEIDDAPVVGNPATVPAGTYSALTSSSFDNLIGAPLNGNWQFVIVDLWAADDGTLFSWNLNFDESLLPPPSDIASEAWDSDPSITNTTGNTITVQPATAGIHCYTYRVTDDFGCEYTEEVCIEVYPEITDFTPNNLYLCNPGAPPYIFDLTENTPVILATTPVPVDYVVTYHETQQDADDDTNAISPADAYVGTDGQVIYVRLEYLTSGCYSTETFTLNITDQPLLNAVPDLEVCDDVSNDGFAQFDLESQTAGILGGQTATDFIVTYHTSFANADTSTGALTSPYTNISDPQPIYVRIESVGDATCNNVSATPLFNLVVLESDDASFTMDPTCDGATADVTGDVGGTFAFNPVPTDGAIIDSADGTVTNGTSGATYTVEYTIAGDCLTTTAVTFTLETTDDSSFTMTPLCDSAEAEVTGVTGGTFAFNPVPVDGALINPLDGTVTNGTSGTTYTVEYTTAGVCASTSSDSFVFITTDDSTFTMTATCDGGTAIIDGNSGGSFTLNPEPGDGAVIDDETGTIINGTSGATYTVEYTTAGSCPSSSTRDVTVLLSSDPSFTVTPSCNGGTATITGDLGGSFAFNPVPTDGAMIDPDDGEVTGATPSTTYTIEYTTIGDCPVSSTQVLTTLDLDDASFTMTPTCDGATATVTGLGGGTFTFTTPPADTAVIDPAMGTVIGGTPGATYTVTYTTVGDCSNTSEVTFTANPLPLVVDPTPLEVCDDNVPDGFTEIDLTLKNTEITGNTPTSIVSYYLTQAEADTGDITTALPIPYTNIANPQTVYVRVENVNTGCYDTTTLELIVEQAPVANVPTPLEYCDPDSDGFGVFDIAGTENEITGGVAGLSVTYHETLSNAENGVNELSSPYNNIVANTQTIYVRIESATIATDCATIVPLVLIVNPTPQIEDPTPLQVCDDALADGFAQFDLTTKNAEILDGLDATQYIVSYYELEADAEVPTNVIATPAAYTNTVAFNQTLWVRVDDTVNGCFKITSLDLIVNALPVLVQPTELTLCDVNNSGDEMEAFTLEDANAEILNGQTGITLTYYETQANANSGTNEITSPYVNTVNPQTVYVRAENDNTGCVSTITLTLRVNPIPSPAVPNPIEVCDEDNDGFASFDLESRTLEIINGELDIQITYHETQDDANAGQDPLVSPYNNIVANSQIVHARAENTVTGCFTVVPLELIVLPSPVIPVNIDDYVICDTNDDGFAQFDLTTKNAEILGTQPPADFTLTYHLNQANADLGTNPIINVLNYTNVTNPQMIYVRLVSAVNGCVSTGQFDIRVELPPVAIQPTPLALCDDDLDDEITVFDLTVKNTEITGGEGSWSVRYYETNADAQADTNVIDPDTAYTNTVNPQTLFVRVTDTDTGCTDFVTLTIRVLPNPTPSTDPENLALCDDINTGDGQEVFDLTVNQVYIINGEVGVTASYYTDPDDAEAGVNAIADPTMYTNANTDYTAETIYVRVTNNVTGCYTIVQFNIIVNPLPEVVAVTDYIICELNNDGAAGFDLTTKDAEVLNGQDPSIFEVTYHVSQADADNLNNALVSPYINVSNPQPIYVAITNNV
uniref:PKD domain-containing protein n=1 Tax=Gelidibacter sp. TaxID=2018083 RepID=UPI00404A982C